eukprot:jgi/Bigna1/135459/aug1.29_g10167
MDPQVFSQIDSDGDGYVSRDEWEDFSRRKSCPAELVTKVSAFIGKDFGERVSKAEFIDYMDRIWEDQENVISDDERSSMGIRRDGSLDEDIRTNFLGGGLSKSFDEGDVGIQRLNGDTFEERLGKCSEENQKLKDENKGLKNKIEGLEKILREYEAEQKQQQQQQQQGKIAESQWKELKTLIIKSHEELGKTVKTVNDKISESFRNISGQLSSSFGSAKRNREIYAKKKKEEKKEQEERRKAKIKARSFDFDKNPPQTPTAKKVVPYRVVAVEEVEKKKQQQAKKTSVSSTMGEEGDGETMDGLDTTVTTPICTPNNRSTRNNMDESREEVAKTAIHDVTESIKKHIKKMSDEALSRIRQSGGSEDEMKQIKSELQKETKDVQKILEIMKTVKKDVKDVADRKDANTKALAPPQTNSLVKIQKEIKSELKNSLQVITDTIKTSGKREEYPAVLVLVWIAVVIAAFCWRSDDLDIQYT